jgi:hypothetical protein
MRIANELAYTIHRIMQEEAQAAAAIDLHAYLAHAQLAALYRQRFALLAAARASGDTLAAAA